MTFHLKLYDYWYSCHILITSSLNLKKPSHLPAYATLISSSFFLLPLPSQVFISFSFCHREAIDTARPPAIYAVCASFTFFLFFMFFEGSKGALRSTMLVFVCKSCEGPPSCMCV